MFQGRDEQERENWAQRTAQHLVDGILGASERSDFAAPNT
jgi:hypothetical protein